MGRRDRARRSGHAIDVVVDGAAGFTFGLGLAVSGMMSPAKVSGFLSVTRASFDPSLMFVMGGAMAVTMIGMRVIGAHTGRRPACSYNSFDFSSNTKIDKPLLLGGVLFGAAGAWPAFAPVPPWCPPSRRRARKLDVDRLLHRGHVGARTRRRVIRRAIRSRRRSSSIILSII